MRSVAGSISKKHNGSNGHKHHGGRKQRNHHDHDESKNTVLVTEGDEMIGFYAARACLTSRKFEKVVVAVHDKNHEFAQTLEKEGAHVKEWDLKNKNSIRHCLQDIDCLLLVPHPSFDTVEKTRNILEVIEQEMDDESKGDDDENEFELKKLVFWGPLFAALDDERRRLDHKNVVKIAYELERLIKKGPVEDWTIVRLGFMMQTLFALSEVIQNRGVIPLAIGEGEFAPVNLKDCARATVTILSEFENDDDNDDDDDDDEDSKKSRKHKKHHSRKHKHHRRSESGKHDDDDDDDDDNDDDNDNDGDDFERQILTFTGSQLIDGEELAERASRGLGSGGDLRFEPVSIEEMRQILESESSDDLNSFQVEMMLQGMELIEKDKLAIRSHDLQKVLKGREPTTVEKWFEENAAQFKPRGGRIARLILQDY